MYLSNKTSAVEYLSICFDDTKIYYNDSFRRAGALVQWLWEETHVPNVVGSNPGIVYWMDIFFTFICCKNV